MTRHINVKLPETTIESINRIAKPGERNQFINRAIEHYIFGQRVEAVRKRLEAALIRDADIEREVNEDWRE